MSEELIEFSIVGYFNHIVQARSKEEALEELLCMQLDQLDKVDIDDIDSA
jgi:hypothetical protein